MEIWKNIEGYKNYYQVSNHGNIKSLRFNKEKILKPANNGRGYLFVILFKNGNSKQFYIHRLVVQTFILNSYNKPCVNHKDGDKQNNRVDNLEWVTKSENHKHAVINKLDGHGCFKGIDNANAILSNNDIYDIINLYNSKMIIQKDIGEIYGINQSHVSRIINHISWKHLTGSE